MSSVSIVGSGYVGLCTGVCLAERGYSVILSDVDEKKVNLINQGIPPLYEPKLEEMLKHVRDENRLKAVNANEEAVLNSDLTFICVGTPSRPSGKIDLKYVKDAAQEIGEALAKKKSYHLVIVKSTVTPGTTVELVKPSVEKASGGKAGLSFGSASS